MLIRYEFPGSGALLRLRCFTANACGRQMLRPRVFFSLKVVNGVSLSDICPATFCCEVASRLALNCAASSTSPGMHVSGGRGLSCSPGENALWLTEWHIYPRSAQLFLCKAAPLAIPHTVMLYMLSYANGWPFVANLHQGGKWTFWCSISASSTLIN